MSGLINPLSPFGKYLKNKLMEINQTQGWIAKGTGISNQTISRLIRGVDDNPDKIEKIKDFLREYEKENKDTA